MVAAMNAHAREVAAILEVTADDYAAAPGFEPSQEDIIKMTASYEFRDIAATYLISAMKWSDGDAREAHRLFTDSALWSTATAKERRRVVENVVLSITIPF
jgi:hypothetical protein